MDLDRQTIEKKDFPLGRRGYDTEAVDAHLQQLANEVDDLRRAAQHRTRPAGESLASVAAAQVQAIVQAAETTAAEIRREADEDASRVNRAAEREAENTRADAVQRAQGHVESVSKASATMLQRVDAMESEVNALIESLRTGANRLTADLALLEGNMSELYDAAGSRAGGAGSTAGASALTDDSPPAQDYPEYQDSAVAAATESEIEAEIEAELELEAEAIAAEPELELTEVEVVEIEVEPEPELEAVELEAQAEATEDLPVAEPELEEAEEEEASGTSADLDGARLIALNMALNGQPREEADRYLADNFDIPDRKALLDEVYAAVEG